MKQHGSKYFAPYPYSPPSPILGKGSVGQNSTFSEHGNVAYEIKENHKCSNKVANILPADLPPPPTMRMGSVGKNSTFSEHGHVAYQIKENHKCSNMVANIFPSRQCTEREREMRSNLSFQLISFQRVGQDIDSSNQKSQNPVPYEGSCYKYWLWVGGCV